MTEIRPKRDDFCCDPCEEFKELTQAAHDSLVCRIDKMEEQLRNVKLDVGARDVKTTFENTKREMVALIARMLKVQKEMNEYRAKEHDSMRRDLDEHTTKVWKELEGQRKVLEQQEYDYYQQSQDMNEQKQIVKAMKEQHEKKMVSQTGRL